MAKWVLPPRRRLPWPLRGLDTASHSLESDPVGRLVMTIDHATLPGLTPGDLAWWFANIGGDVEVEGQRMSRYLAWHPIDHIHWSLHRPGPNGLAEVGAEFRIVEALGGDLAHLIDVTETVTRLDLSGITLEKRIAGQLVSRLSHEFGQGALGATYSSRLTVGLACLSLGRLANPLVQKLVFSRAMGHAWIRHNIEEVGLLVHLVPLVRQQAGGA